MLTQLSPDNNLSEQIDMITKNEKAILQKGNIKEINRMHEELNVLINKSGALNDIFTFKDYIQIFQTHAQFPYQNQEKANSLIATGNKAIDDNNQNQLMYIISNLKSLQDLERKNNSDFFRNEGTGLK